MLFNVTTRRWCTLFRAERVTEGQVCLVDTAVIVPTAHHNMMHCLFTFLRVHFARIKFVCVPFTQLFLSQKLCNRFVDLPPTGALCRRFFFHHFLLLCPFVICFIFVFLLKQLWIGCVAKRATSLCDQFGHFKEREII